MNPKIDNKKYLSKGYSVKKTLTSNANNNNNNHDKNNDDVDDAKRYPNGIIPFIALLAFYVIFLIVVLSLGFTNKDISTFFPWYWSTLCAAIVYFLMNILWWIGRTGFANTSGYMMMKLARVIKVRKIIDWAEFYINDPAINEVNNMQEYETFVLIKRKYTKKFFYISLLTSFILLVINLIVSLSVYYAVYA